MLAIREAQMKTLGGYVQQRFAARMSEIFVRAYPRECRQSGGPAAMLQWAEYGVRSATDEGYRTEYEAGRWLALMMILGVDFAVDPQLPWVRDCLDPALAPDPSDRVDLAFERTLDYLGETAGEDSEILVRALLRIRDVDFGALPALPADDAVADACARLHTLYPQKYEFQGAVLTAKTVASQVKRARELGLHGPSGEFLFVVLSFMMGSGFDHDPLHPWAGAILHAQTDDGDRTARLEAAARDHLAISLSNA
jgi:hypothetical protein